MVHSISTPHPYLETIFTLTPALVIATKWKKLFPPSFHYSLSPCNTCSVRWSMKGFAILMVQIWVLCWSVKAESGTGASARTHKALLHVRPKTGLPYDGNVPSNMTVIKIAAMRVRSGSLRSRGVSRYKEFVCEAICAEGCFSLPEFGQLVATLLPLGLAYAWLHIPGSGVGSSSLQCFPIICLLPSKFLGSPYWSTSVMLLYRYRSVLCCCASSLRQGKVFQFQILPFPSHWVGTNYNEKEE